MRTIVEFEANEIVHDAKLSVYNRIVYQLLKPTDKWTHLMEKYDDMSETPEFQLGRYENGEWMVKAGGYGEEIPHEKLGRGGVWFPITIEYTF